jgi:hypothetical protein
LGHWLGFFGLSYIKFEQGKNAHANARGRVETRIKGGGCHIVKEYC